YYSFLNPLNWLVKDARSGQLHAFIEQLKASANEEGTARAEQLELLLGKFQEVKEHWESLTGLLYEMAENRAGAQGDNGYVMRIKNEQLPDQWPQILLIEDNIYVGLTEICRTMD